MNPERESPSGAEDFKFPAEQKEESSEKIPKKTKKEKSKEDLSEKRKALVGIMNQRIEELNAEEAHARETIKYEAPYLKDIAQKKKFVQELIDLVENESDTPNSKSLEAIQKHFEENKNRVIL